MINDVKDNQSLLKTSILADPRAILNTQYQIITNNITARDATHDWAESEHHWATSVALI